MFSLSETAIDVEALRKGLDDVRAGALATFEGRVRDHNEGQTVLRLEYEAYGALAVKEGGRIIEEAKVRFDIYECICVHRTGSLGLGELAVWVGVTAAHRDAAFDACRFIIDETKKRVPIWKKEHYVNGDTGWVNCAHHTDADANWHLDVLEMSGSELSKFEIVDIREPVDQLLRSLLRRDVLQMPVSTIDVKAMHLDPAKKYLFVCQRGFRSDKIVSALRAAGHNNVFSLAGGVESVRRKYIA